MNNIYMWAILIAIIGVFFFAITVVLKYSRKKQLTPTQKTDFRKKLKYISSHTSPKEKITDADKLYHKILKGLGYEGSFGEILKQEPNEIGDIQKIWKLHKLRNNLVHDFDEHDDMILNKHAKNYIKEINILIK